MSACCIPVCGRTVGWVLFSIWMMIGAPEAPILAVDPDEGTCTMVVNASFQSAKGVSCLRLAAVLGTSSVWLRLWLSTMEDVTDCPVLSQVTAFSSSAVPSSSSGVRAGSIGWENVTFSLPRSGTACWPSTSAASLNVTAVIFGAGSVRKAML